MAKHIRIVLADDHFATRQGLLVLLEQEQDFTIVGEAWDGLEALRLVEELRPDLLVTDLSMPHLNGVDVLRRAKKQNSGLKVIVLSMHTADHYVARAIQAGASAYILKNSTGKELVNAVRAALLGQRYLGQPFAEKGIGFYDHLPIDDADSAYRLLTNREQEVFRLAAEGLTNNQIAVTLNIGTRTVETHRSNLMRKLNLKSSAELIRYAIREGILPLED